MKDIVLLPDEKVLKFSNEKILTLTNKRLIKISSENGFETFTFVFLDKISSITLSQISYYNYFIFAAISALIGFFGKAIPVEFVEIIPFLGYGVAIVFVVLFFVTRRFEFQVFTGSYPAIKFNAKGIKERDIQSFLYELQKQIIKNESKTSKENIILSEE